MSDFSDDKLKAILKQQSPSVPEAPHDEWHKIQSRIQPKPLINWLWLSVPVMALAAAALMVIVRPSVPDLENQDQQIANFLFDDSTTDFEDDSFYMELIE